MDAEPGAGDGAREVHARLVAARLRRLHAEGASDEERRPRSAICQAQPLTRDPIPVPRPDPHPPLPVTAGHTSPTPVVGHLSVDPALALLEIVAYGQVWDGQPADHVLTSPESDAIGFLLDRAKGTVVGFGVRAPHALDVFALKGADVWDGPRFDVPALALRAACVGDVVLAVQARFDVDEPTIDVVHFAEAARLEAEDTRAALGHWRVCLEAGGMRAHYGLGCALVEAGRPRQGYDHLRFYTELTPCNAWAWCWLGRAALAMGEREEGVIHLKRAMHHEADCGYDTIAGALLEELFSGGG